MKKSLFLFILLIVSAVTFGQVSATANISETIVQPLTITKVIDMDFGNVAIDAVAGTVVLAPNGSRTKTGGAILTAVTGTPAAAVFNLTGASNYTYAISLPTSGVNVKFGNNTMVVNNFTSSPTPTGTLGVNGKDVVNVGATLNVLPNQAAGTYHQETPFTVTVNYN